MSPAEVPREEATSAERGQALGAARSAGGFLRNTVGLAAGVKEERPSVALEVATGQDES